MESYTDNANESTTTISTDSTFDFAMLGDEADHGRYLDRQIKGHDKVLADHEIERLPASSGCSRVVGISGT